MRPKQADIRIGLSQSAELFHTHDATGFADLDINGHRETWPIRPYKDTETDDIPAEVARLGKLDAKLINRMDRWVVMQAPTG